MIWQFIIKNKNIQTQLSDGWDDSQEQKYTGATVITIYWIDIYILLYMRNNNKNLISCC